VKCRAMSGHVGPWCGLVWLAPELRGEVVLQIGVTELVSRSGYSQQPELVGVL
jgi:hypothetical protein